MSNLLTFKYWFAVNPGSLAQAGYITLITIAGLSFILAIVVLILKRKKGSYKRIYANLYDFLVANFVLSLLFLFFHFENIPFFTARFWLLIWLAEMIIWLYFIIKKARLIPQKRKVKERDEEIKKYLP